MTTCAFSPPNDWRQTELDLSTSSAEASRVRTSAPLEKGADCPGHDLPSGGNTIGLSQKSGPHGSSSKMSPAFALRDWSRFSAASLRSGMMRSGTVFPLPPLAHLTGGTGSGFWPTPQTKYDGRTHDAWLRAKVRAAEKHRAGLYGKGCGAPGMMDLRRAVRMAEGATTGELNPKWLAWLMGFDPAKFP